jgi:hypothetical protein
MIKVVELPPVRGLREALHHWCVIAKENGTLSPIVEATFERYSAEIPEFERFVNILYTLSMRLKLNLERVWWKTYAYRGRLVKTHYGYKWFPEPEDDVESCVRKNMNLVGPEGYFIGWHSSDKYQHWRKHLYTKKGICRRCGCTKENIKRAAQEIANPDAPWKRPLTITPVDQAMPL